MSEHDSPFLNQYGLSTERIANGSANHMHTIINARIQLVATVSNNLAAAFVVAGYVASAVTGQLPSGGGSWVTLARIGLGFMLHVMTQLVPGRLRVDLGSGVGLADRANHRCFHHQSGRAFGGAIHAMTIR